MTETTTAPPPDAGPPPPPANPLVRPRTDRVFRGVCAAVGRATGTDPVLWRVIVVVLAVFGGTGIVLYLAGWLLIPEEGSTESEAQRLVRGGPVSKAVTIVAVVLGVVALAALFDNGRGAVPLLVIGGIAYLVLRNRQGRAVPPPDAVPAGWQPPPAWTGPAGEQASWAPAYGPPPPPVFAAPAPPRPRSPLGLLTLSAVVLTTGLLLLARTLGADGIDLPVVLAADLLVTGVGLVIGARWGRARGLIALGVVLALMLSAASAFSSRWTTTSGDRTWAAAAGQDRRLGIGEATLDLQPLAGSTGTVPVSARVGVGHLIVLVPQDLSVVIDARVRAGVVTVVQPDGTRTQESGTDVHRIVQLGPAGVPTVRLDARVGLGEVEVRHVAAG